MIIRQLFEPETSSFTYILADAETREAVIIDPVLDMHDRDLRLINELKLDLLYTLDTHIHADHITGSGLLRSITGAISVAGIKNQIECLDRPAKHGEKLEFGKYTLEVRATPGHTNGCVTFVVRDSTNTYAFTGDTLLVRGCGRTDFQDGSASALYDSVHREIFSLPPETIIYPGHDYRGHRESTVAEEKQHNPRLNKRIIKSQFEEIMSALELPRPKHINIAVPANMSCGQPERMPSPSPHAPPRNSEVIDIRESDEFVGTLGHLANARNIPFEDLLNAAKSWDRDRAFTLICQSGRRSHTSLRELRDLGFTRVSEIEGGMIGIKTRLENGDHDA